jgi:hypothetical protein
MDFDLSMKNSNIMTMQNMHEHQCFRKCMEYFHRKQSMYFECDRQTGGDYVAYNFYISNAVNLTVSENVFQEQQVNMLDRTIYRSSNSLGWWRLKVRNTVIYMNPKSGQ